jgi:eukaryotic-like serine/threonine-protein kinase
MSAEGRARCDALVERALTLPPAARGAFLDRACGEDRSLRSEVERLLARDGDGAGAFLDGRALDLVARETGGDTGGQTRSGERIAGRFTLLARVGAGGMGEVFRARDEELDRDVALKFLQDDGPPRAESRDQLSREARALCVLTHPHICTLYDLRWNGDTPFLVMEYLSGETLADRIARGALSLDELAPIATQIAGALAEAHRAGVVHRDLKPANVMLTPNGVKVFDFGIAKRLLRPVGDPRTTVAGSSTIVGSASYMSPEQAQGRHVDARSDVFSFGCVLYEMLTGRRAFVAASFLGAIDAVRDDEPPPLSDAAPHTPPALAALVARSLRKDPSQRYADMGALVEDLRPALTSPSSRPPARDSREGSGATASDRPAAGVWTRPGGWRARWPLLAGGLALVVSIAVSLLQTSSPNARSDTPTLSPLPLTSYIGNEGRPSLSPDGTQVAFVGTVADVNNSDIYVQVIGSSATPLRLTTDPAVEGAPLWSPNGQWIIFARGDELKQTKTFRISPLGGAETLLDEHACHPSSWAPDSSWYACTDIKTRGIFAVRADGQRLGRMTHPPSEVEDYGGAISPDGTRMLFARQPPSDDDAEALVVDLRPGGAVRSDPISLGRLNGTLTGAAWLPNGRDAVAGIWDQGKHTFGLFRLSTTPSAGGPIPLALPDGAMNPVLDRAGRRLVYTQHTVETDLWRFAAGAAAPHRLSSTKMDMAPRLSPDARRVAFSSNRSGAWQIWLAEADGSHPRQLTSEGLAWNASWSPDGSRIVFAQAIGSRFSDIYVVNAAGGTPRRLTDNPGNEGSPSFSRDGQFIYFSSDRTGSLELFRMSADGQAVTQITRTGLGGIGIETFDGAHIVYVSREGDGRITNSSGGEARTIFRPAFGTEFEVRPDGVYFIANAGEFSLESRVMVYEFATASTRHAFTLPGEAASLTIGNDGTTLYSRYTSRGGDLMLIDGFR